MRIYLIAAITACAASAYGLTESKVSKYFGVRLVGELSDSRQFEFEIHRIVDAAGDPRSGGIEALILKIDGAPISVPDEALAGLRDVQLPGPHIVQEGETVLIVVPGGDGGEAYTCVFAVKSGRVVRRDIYKPPFRSGQSRAPTATEVY